MLLVVLILFFILWLLRTLKDVLFWVYLWQLKEYHVKRFIDHFRTAKGKDLLLDKKRIVKLFLLIISTVNPLIVFILLPVAYFIESAKSIFDFQHKRLLKPVFTGKTIAVIVMVVSLEIIFLLGIFSLIEGKTWLSVLFFPPLLLIVDILTPVIVFWAVLAFKPITNFFIKGKLNETKKKLEGFKDLTVIGIAGSYGKTSTKEFLFEILSSKYNVLKTKKNINAEIGIAKTILEELNENHNILIVEIGAYEKGKIKEVCGIINPDIGVLTGINEQHLATFGSQENIKKAKQEIIECSKAGFEKDKIDLRATDVRTGGEFIFFKIDNVDFKVNVLGTHNIENILLVIAVAQKLGMSLGEIAQACLKIKPSGMTLLKKDPVIIDSSYSANPTGVIADLNYLNTYSGKKLIVMPCLIELGSASAEAHKRIGKKMAEVCDLAIITSRECFEVIRKEFPQAIYLESSREIVKKIKEFDAVLLEGRIPKGIKKALAGS